MVQEVQTAPAATLSGAERAALILTSLGLDTAAAILKVLPEDEVALLAAAMERVRSVPPQVRVQALGEFKAQLRGDGSSDDRLDIRMLLEHSIGAEKAMALMARIKPRATPHAHFAFLSEIDPQQSFDILHHERPQTLSLVLCHLDSKRAAELLAHFPPDTQTQVLARMGRMQPVTPEIIARVADALRGKLGTVRAAVRESGGPKRIAEVLNHLSRQAEKQIFDSLQIRDAHLVDDVRKHMIAFDDLVSLPASAMQAVLREIDISDLCLALKGAREEFKQHIMRNLSKRAAERLKEEMDLQGPRPRKEVKDARQRLLAVVRRLEDEGKIALARGGADDELVA
jgi:flagellar motor switch protein FliG